MSIPVTFGRGGRPGGADAAVGLLRARPSGLAGLGEAPSRAPLPTRAAGCAGALRIPAAAVLAVWLTACTGAAPQEDTGACHRDPPLTWANFGQGWMDKHCVGCHSSLLRDDQRNGAPVGIDLDTWEDAIAWGDRIGARSVGDNATMPPGGGPSAEERRLLAEWLDCAVAPAAAGEGE